MKQVRIFTDGSARPNPGPGGWAYLLVYTNPQNRPHERLVSGHEDFTTNQRMELMAAIQGLGRLREPCDVRLYTDSSYLITVANGGTARRNTDLVEQLRTVASQHQVTWIHVPAHAGHPENERVDAAAHEAALGRTTDIRRASVWS